PSLRELFGPQRAPYRPDMPFWRFQGDGFWHLQNAERCYTFGSSRRPPAGELVENNVAGGFDKQHYCQLIKSKRMINSLSRQIRDAQFTG
ncbi:restriction endonuclease, partial [Escherichia coli]